MALWNTSCCTASAESASTGDIVGLAAGGRSVPSARIRSNTIGSHGFASTTFAPVSVGSSRASLAGRSASSVALIPTLYGYQAATMLADGSSAPARRVAQFPTLDALSVVDANAAALFFATPDWLLGKS